jgi:hypothetical protein
VDDQALIAVSTSNRSKVGELFLELPLVAGYQWAFSSLTVLAACWTDRWNDEAPGRRVLDQDCP